MIALTRRREQVPQQIVGGLTTQTRVGIVDQPMQRLDRIQADDLESPRHQLARGLAQTTIDRLHLRVLPPTQTRATVYANGLRSADMIKATEEAVHKIVLLRSERHID